MQRSTRGEIEPFDDAIELAAGRRPESPQHRPAVSGRALDAVTAAVTLRDALQVLDVGLEGPAMKDDETPIGHRVDQDVGDGCGLGRVETWAKPAEVGDAADDGAGAVASLLVGGGEQGGGVGVGVRGDDEDVVERGEPPGDGRRSSSSTRRAAAAGSSPCIMRCTSGRSAMATGSSSPASVQSKASLSTAALPPTDVNTVRRLTPARCGDGVDRGRHVPALDEELAAGVDDATPGDPGLLVTERGPVRAGASVMARIPSARVAQLDMH